MKAIDVIFKKNNGEKLEYKEIAYMVNSYVKGRICDRTMSEFIWQIYNDGLSYEETCYLTDVMIKSGEVIDLSSIDKPVVDKHSTGGVGDKVTLIVSAIVAASGCCVPKMSGRGLGLTGGTVDKLESITGYKLNLTKKQFLNALDSVGCDVIVIDLKVGSGAFMKTIREATSLAKTMVKIGKYYDKKVVCTLSDMNIPLGKNIGNALEVKEAIDFFAGKYDKRLYDLCVYLSALMISTAKNTSFKKAKELTLNLIQNGHAKTKFYQWIKNQGGDITKLKDKAKKMIVVSPTSGYINKIDAMKLAQLVFDLGAGRVKKTDKIDYAAGVVLNHQLGEKVTKGDVLGVIYYNKKVENMDKLFTDAFKIEKKKKRQKNIIIKTIK